MPKHKYPLKQPLAVDLGRWWINTPASLCFRWKILSATISPQVLQRDCAPVTPHLDKTLYVSFLPSVSCLPIRPPSIPWGPLPLKPNPFPDLFLGEPKPRHLFFLVFSCNLFYPCFLLFFQERGKTKLPSCPQHNI